MIHARMTKTDSKAVLYQLVVTSVTAKLLTNLMALGSSFMDSSMVGAPAVLTLRPKNLKNWKVMLISAPPSRNWKDFRTHVRYSRRRAKVRSGDAASA